MNALPLCPSCGQELQEVRQPANSMLNSDQFDAIKAGDFFCEQCRGNRDIAYFWRHELQQATAKAPMSLQETVAVLQPLLDLGDFHSLNGPAGGRLAELIAPGDAMDLTVRELHALLAQVHAEMSR